MNTILAQFASPAAARKVQSRLDSLVDELDWDLIQTIYTLMLPKQIDPATWKAISRIKVLSQAGLLYRMTAEIADADPPRFAGVRKEQRRTLRDLWIAIALVPICRFAAKVSAEAFDELLARWEETIAEWDAA